jgi:DUF4097 and DUF4098 domain-containing protein YvlB
LTVAWPVTAQQVPFARTLDAGPTPHLAIETARGQVEVTGADIPAVEVTGTVVVRLGWNVPADAAALAKAAAAAPPIATTGSKIDLTLPRDERTRRAVLIHWRVKVPRRARVEVRTDSGEVHLARVAGPVRIDAGSSAVTVDDATGGLSVTGRSGALTLAGLAGDIRVRTGSGSVRIAMAGAGVVDVESRSSAIAVAQATAGLVARSGSGAIDVSGRPTGNWEIETRSSQITVEVPRDADCRLDLRSRSGKVASELPPRRDRDTHAVVSPPGPGPVVTARSGSGAIILRTSLR